MNFKKNILKITQAVFLILLSFQGMAKQTDPLKIDDKVPDIKFTMLNYQKQTARLSDFKGKLVILDFWATWCGSCIDNFPNLESLQKKFQGRIQVILVNSIGTDNKQKVSDFFKKWKNSNGMSFQLATAINDKKAKELFPHQEIPHYAWIFDRRVKAITSSAEVTVNNIEKILRNDRNDVAVAMPLKADFFPNQLVNLPVDKILVDEDFPYYKLFRKGKIENIQTVNNGRLERGGKITDYTNKSRGRALINMPLLDIYKSTFYYNKKFFSPNTEKRIILDIKDSSGLIYNPTHFRKDEWETKNLYSYDIVVPAEEYDSLYTCMINDLNHYSGYYGRIEKRKVKCLALVRTSAVDKIKTKGGPSENKLDMEFEKRYVTNYSLWQLRQWLDLLDNIKLPVIDETGYAGFVDIELSVDFNDFAALRRAFNTYDLDLVEVDREIDMFVISEKAKSITTKSN